MSEIKKLIRKLEKSNIFNNKDESWDLENMTNVAMLIYYVKDLQKQLSNADVVISDLENKGKLKCNRCDKVLVATDNPLNPEYPRIGRQCEWCDQWFCFDPECPENDVQKMFTRVNTFSIFLFLFLVQCAKRDYFKIYFLR